MTAETQLTTLRAVDPSNKDVEAINILFANEYERNGRRQESLYHLRLFIAYIATSISKNPALADTLPPLIARYTSAVAMSPSPFLGGLYRQLISDVRRLNPDTQFEAAFASYRAALAICEFTTPGDIGDLLLEWINCYVASVRSDGSLHPDEERLIRAFLGHVSTYSVLVSDKTLLTKLEHSLALLERELVARQHSPERRAETVKLFEICRKLLQMRNTQLQTVGEFLTEEARRFLENRGPDDQVGTSVILFWSPQIPGSNTLLSNVASIVSRFPGVRFSVVVPYHGDGGQEKLPSETIVDLQERLARGRTYSVILSHVENEHIRRFGLTMLPQVCVVNRYSRVTEFFHGFDSTRSAILARALDREENPVAAPKLIVGKSAQRTCRLRSVLARVRQRCATRHG